MTTLRRWVRPLLVLVSFTLIAGFGLPPQAAAEPANPDVFYYNGVRLPGDPRVDIKEYLDKEGVNPYGADRLADLIPDPVRTLPAVVNYSDLPLGEQKLPLEQRAIDYTRWALANHLDVNVLPGTLYILEAQDYVGMQKGAVDPTDGTISFYHNAILYLESGEGEMRAVLVSTFYLATEAFTDYIRLELGGDVGRPYLSPEGMSNVEPFTGKYKREGADYLEWTAAAFMQKCEPVVPSSQCLYKVPQGKLALFPGQDQILFVGPLGLLEFDIADPSTLHPGERFVGSFHEVPLARDRTMYAGWRYSRWEGKGQLNDLAELQRDGAYALGGEQLKDLPAYRLPE